MPRSSTTWKPTGTKFFRLGSSKILSQWGQNMQNIEKSLRALYIPDGYEPALDDIKLYYWLSCHSVTDLSIFTELELARLRCLIQVDQAGAEALVVAYLCRHGQYRELFIHGIKPHVFIALHNFHNELKMHTDDVDIITTINVALVTPIKDLKHLKFWKKLDTYIRSTDNWPPQQRYYFIAKMICHALSYGMRAPTFQINVLKKSEGKIVLTKLQSETFYLKFHALFPEIMEWHAKVRESVMKTRIVYNCLGYPITFTAALDESDMKDVYAAAPQSTVGCITHLAYTALYNMNKPEWDLLNNCHDSYVTQCPLTDIKECSDIMVSLMKDIKLVSPMNNEIFSMRSEAQFGFNWAPAKELDATFEGDITNELINKYNLVGLRGF